MPGRTGVVMALLDHIPAVGEEIEIGRHKISVLKADAKSIQRVLITEMRPQEDR
jgi:Mg2+/Co2+ transporter CorC